MPKLPTDYAAHDALYRARKARGDSGWDSEQTTQENIDLLRRISDHGWLGAPGSVLELGCGAGNLTRWFADQGWTAHGIDISPTAIAWASDHRDQARHGIDYRVADVVTLEASRRFDLVFDGHCLHCIIGADRARFLEFARESLQPGGTLLIVSMCGDFPEGVGRGHFDANSRCQIIDGVATRYIGAADSIENEVKSAGFEVAHATVVPRRHSAETDQIVIAATPLRERRRVR